MFVFQTGVPRTFLLERSDEVPAQIRRQAFAYYRHFDDEPWQRVTKKQAGIEGKILDIFRRAWLGEGPRRAIRASVRVATEDKDEILAKSGSGGLLFKEFETEHVAGGVRWIRKLDDESGADYLSRAFSLDELQTPKKGLTFASSGSLGLRVQAGQVPSMWRVEGFLQYVAAEDAVANTPRLRMERC